MKIGEIREFIEDCFDYYLGWIIVSVIVLLVAGLAFALRSDSKRREASCARAWTIARTSTDSLAVIKMCELREVHVQPAPVYIYPGR